MALSDLMTFPKRAVKCYYYTDSSKHALDILKNRHLFGSIPSRVNDPDDLQIHPRNLRESKCFKQRVKYWEELFHVSLEEPNLLTIEQRVKNRSIEWMDSVYRCVCMAEAAKVDADCRSDYRFWSIYANHFQGVRFKFLIDSNFLSQPSPDKTYFDRIVYDGQVAELDFSTIFTLSDLRAQLLHPAFLQSLLYSKSPAWECEYEWRLGSNLRYLDKQPSLELGGSAYFFKFNLDHLLKVDIGVMMKPNEQEELKETLEKLNIRTSVASLPVCYSAMP